MAQGNKSRIVIWTIVGILVVAAVVFLLIARKGAGPTTLPFASEDVPGYLDKIGGRLDRLAMEATELRAEYGAEQAETFAQFDATMEKARAAMQELPTLTDEQALRAKHDEIEDYRLELSRTVRSLKR